MDRVVIGDGHVHLHQTLRGVRRALEEKRTQKNTLIKFLKTTLIQEKQIQPKPERCLRSKTICVLVTGFCSNFDT